MLRIDHLVKRYGDRTAVDGLTLRVGPGELWAFIGPNGAGKTSTLRCCCGIQGFDSGRIEVCGTDVAQDPIAAKSHVAYLPDNPDLYEFMTGIGFLYFVADIYGVPKCVRDERIGELSERFAIAGDLGQRIAGYSHGMKQKVSIIAALVHRPDLLVMDEPFVGLDPIASRQLKDVMVSMCGDGRSILYSTHVLEVAERLCTHVAVIRGGRLVASGPMDEIRGDGSLEDAFIDLEGGRDA